MSAAIAKTIVACNSDSCNASPSSSSSSSPSSSSTLLQLLPAPRTAFRYITTSPTRSVATSMFEVPLDRPCNDSHVEGNLILEPLNHFFPTNPSFQHTFFENSQGRRQKKNGRRRFRARFLSLPKGFSKNGDFLSVIGSTGLPMARSGRLQGAGVCMALVVALITLLAAVKQGLSMGSHQHQEISCLMCNGLRFHRCALCKGRGIVEWEGKLRHTDPCPRCFGSCHMKCSKCGG